MDGAVYSHIVEVRLGPVRVPPLNAEEAFDEVSLRFDHVRAVLLAELTQVVGPRVKLIAVLTSAGHGYTLSK
jgi:hypothetical protein